jgi:hypothetical protein
MNRALTVVAALAAVIGPALGAAAPEPPAAAPEAAGWLKSFDAAQSVARQSGKPIFLVFR